MVIITTFKSSSSSLLLSSSNNNIFQVTRVSEMMITTMGTMFYLIAVVILTSLLATTNIKTLTVSAQYFRPYPAMAMDHGFSPYHPGKKIVLIEKENEKRKFLSLIIMIKYDQQFTIIDVLYNSRHNTRMNLNQ